MTKEVLSMSGWEGMANIFFFFVVGVGIGVGICSTFLFPSSIHGVSGFGMRLERQTLAAAAAAAVVVAL